MTFMTAVGDILIFWLYACCLVMKKYLIITFADVSMHGHVVKNASLVEVAFVKFVLIKK